MILLCILEVRGARRDCSATKIYDHNRVGCVQFGVFVCVTMATSLFLAIGFSLPLLGVCAPANPVRACAGAKGQPHTAPLVVRAAPLDNDAIDNDTAMHDNVRHQRNIQQESPTD